MMAENPCLAAALEYAARGWPVLPCSPENKRPLVAADKGADGKPVRGTGGLSKASRDPDQIRAWWTKWPQAMVAVATGHADLSCPSPSAGAGGCFVIDFDPRTDEATGEEWTLDGLKAALEEQMAALPPAAGEAQQEPPALPPAAGEAQQETPELPQSMTARTQSGGVHVWLRWPAGHDPVRNRGNLPLHVDVRGLGGYVIMPPSVMKTGHKYRWLKGRGPGEIAIAEAPAVLLEILGSRAAGAAPAVPADGSDPSPAAIVETGPPRRHADGNGAPGPQDRKEAAQRSYVLRAFDAEVAQVETAMPGTRNQALFDGALKLGQLVATGMLSRAAAIGALEAVARGWPEFDKSQATIANGIEAGLGMPRDLSGVGEIAASAGARKADRRSGPRPPEGGGRGRDGPRQRTASPAARDPAAARGGAAETISTVPDWKAGLDEPARWRVERVVARWLMRQPVPVTADAARSLAYRVGQRYEAGLIDGVTGWLLLHGLTGIDGATADALRDSFEAGQARGFVPDRIIADLDGAALPMTDLGNAERFVRRFGDDFRFTTAKGWMGWDGRRWAVLDQEQDSTPAEVMAAVFTTVRAIQDEARTVAATGERGWAGSPHGLDYVWKATKSSVTMFSEALAAYGRASESSGKLGCIAGLAKRWLTVSIEDFDADPFAINCLNGTILITRERCEVEQPRPPADGKGPPARQCWKAKATLVAHDRAMLISKLAPVEADPAAQAPLYDALLEWAQPQPQMRRYLHQWGGYSASGHVGAQILHFWYGRGANGKSTLADAWAGALGDYAGTIQIETFLDQGIKKRGDAATPDLARLGGVRMLRASEPERGAKLNEALIKAATGGEPMAVRALHRGFFDLRPAFKLTIGGNYKPDVPGTDEGIWRRIKLVPWDSFLAEGQRDEDLPNKLKAEYAGILARLVRGLLDWMENGFAEPQAVTDATADYRADSDPLARFLRLCIAQEDGARTQSSKLHAVFAAWCKAAGEKEWSPKGFAKALKDKGFSNKTSNGVQWLGIRLIKDVGDFIDGEGRVLDLSAMGEAGEASAPVDVPPAPPIDDGWVRDVPDDWNSEGDWHDPFG